MNTLSITEIVKPTGILLWSSVGLNPTLGKATPIKRLLHVVSKQLAPIVP